MSDDRLRILEMVEKKTITAAEAADLLRAVDDNDKATTSVMPKKTSV